MNYTRTKISCYLGYFVQAIIVSFLPLLFVTFNRDYGISYEKLGTLAIITFAVQLAVDILSVKLLKYIGYRGGAVLAHLTAALGFIMLALLPQIMDNKYLAIALSCVIYSIGGGLIEVIISPIIEYLPSGNKAAQMSLLHSFFCWGEVLTVIGATLLFILIGRENWWYVSFIWAAISLVNMLLFIKTPIIEPESGSKYAANSGMLRSYEFYLVMLLMLAAGAAEISVSQWASAFAEMGLGLSKAAGDLLGPCSFAVLMGVGRLLYGIYGGRIKIERAIFFCALLCLGCYVLLFLDIHPAVSLIACALCGLSVSVMWPGTLSLGSARFPLGGTLFFGCAAAFGDSGCSIGPFIMGAITERFSMQTGFIVCAVFPAVIIAVSAHFLKYSCKKRQNVLK